MQVASLCTYWSPFGSQFLQLHFRSTHLLYLLRTPNWPLLQQPTPVVDWIILHISIRNIKKIHVWHLELHSGHEFVTAGIIWNKIVLTKRCQECSSNNLKGRHSILQNAPTQGRLVLQGVLLVWYELQFCKFPQNQQEAPKNRAALLVTPHNALAAGYNTWKLMSAFGSQGVMPCYQGITLIKGFLKSSTLPYIVY